MKHLYQNKDIYYYSTVREDLINLLPKNPSQKVLEVGAAKGDTLVAIKANQLAAEVVGIDFCDMPESNQSNPLIDRFLIADIEKDDLSSLPKNYFDAIICGDVLEHLADPWAAIQKLKMLLKENGLCIVSLPNIRHFSALYKIVVKGDFRYDPEGGLLDKTHFRFFCKKNAIDLFKDSNFQLLSYSPNFLNTRKWSKSRFLNLITFTLFEEFLTVQHIVVSKKVTEN